MMGGNNMACTATMIAALQAENEQLRVSYTGWQPIETIPHDQYVDVWVTSKSNPNYGSRVVNVCRTDRHTGGWVNILPWMIPTHWMPFPPKPTKNEVNHGQG